MDELNDVAVSTLRAANISDSVMSTLSREDLRDLFPGPENVLRRKTVWIAFHGASEEAAVYQAVFREVSHRQKRACSSRFFVSKKMLKPPMGMDKAEQALEILRVLPSLFPSTSALPKRVHEASEALVHILEEKEDPDTYLKKHLLSCPVLIVCSSNCLLAVGDVPVTTFPKDKLDEGALYLMAYYYTLHLTYPRCVATLLSVIQTEVLLDKIHDRDLTSSYKNSMAEWRAFRGQ